MDPDANLEETLLLVRNILKTTDACDDDSDPSYNPRDVLRLAELVEALDGWLSKGNFLPNKWAR